MAARTVDGKLLSAHPVSKKLKTSSAPLHESSSNVPPRNLPPTPPELLPLTVQTSNTYLTRTEITPKTRIVVVRTTQGEPGETVVTNEPTQSGSVDLPPMLTDGRTSVYLIRRPIPPPTLKQTKLYKPWDDSQNRSSTTNNNHQSHTSNSEDIVTSPVPPDSLSLRHSPSTHPDSPRLHSSSPTTQPGTSQRRPRTSRRSRSRSRSRSRPRSRSLHRSTSSQTRNTGIQVNLPPPETVGNGHRRSHHHRSIDTRNTRRKKSATPRIKSAKSILFVNPDDHTVAVVENPYLKGETIKPVIRRPRSVKKTRFHNETVSQSTEKLVKTSRWHTCLGCLSRHMCLIIIICCILIFIGLAGVGVSAYFLATNSSDNLIPKIIGIAIGGILAIAALCFLCCTIGCIGSRDGYFSYKNKDSEAGGRAFALIPPSHPNANLYIPRDYMETAETNPAPSQTSVSTITNTHQQTINRQKTTVNEMNGGTSNAKNLTIEMPERLLTGRKQSPRTHERNLNKVVKNIGHVVEDVKKRYNGEAPNKVIVKVDKNAT